MSEQNAKQETTRAQEASNQAELEKQKLARLHGQRSLIIHVLLMFLVSIVVFVIGSYFFLVPRVVRHRLDARYTANEVAQLKRQVQQLNRVVEQASRPEPVAPADPGEPAAP